MSGDPTYDPQPDTYEPPPYDQVTEVDDSYGVPDSGGDAWWGEEVVPLQEDPAFTHHDDGPSVALVDSDYTPVHVDGETTYTGSPYWFEQAANGLCVPASVAQIVSAYTGLPFTDEAAFVELANESGLFWVGPDGVPSMSAEGALFLMEQAGVPASLVVSASIDTLDAYVDAGHGVVLAVSADEVWSGEPGAGAADHALVVTDIDQADGVAVLSDPGHPDGNGFTVPLEVLEEAWAASDNTMIVAEQPAPTGTWTPAETHAAAVDVPAGVGAVGGGTGVVDEVSVPVGIGELGAAARPELHSTVAETVSWAVQRPWVLLPVAIAAGRLTAR
jgi:hypothetical protein